MRLQKRGRTSRTERGFTLIEALVGVTVFGIALLGLAQMFLVGLRNNKRGDEIGHAVLLAQQGIDQLRTLTAAELSSFPAAERGERDDEELDVNSDGNPDFRRISQVRPAGLAYAVKVIVFPAGQTRASRDDLIANPWANGARAVLNTEIGR